jgi:hypothetical protein
MLQTIYDSLSTPLGTARLLEGFSTLNRADKANVTPEQMRAIFKDLKGRSDDHIRGFLEISQDLVSGNARFAGNAMPKLATDPHMTLTPIP